MLPTYIYRLKSIVYIVCVCVCIYIYMWKVKSLSRARLSATPWIVGCTKLLRPWDFQSKSTGVGCHFLLQGIFPTQGSNPGLSHCRQTLYHLSHQGSLSHCRQTLYHLSHQGSRTHTHCIYVERERERELFIVLWEWRRRNTYSAEELQGTWVIPWEINREAGRKGPAEHHGQGYRSLEMYVMANNP